MIYYVLGLITSTIIFSIFLAALRAPVSSQYEWMAIFSLTLLSGATTLVFLIGLVLRMVQPPRQRNQSNERKLSSNEMLPPSSQAFPSPDPLTLPQSEFARHWIGQRDTSAKETGRDMLRGGEAIRRWLEGEIEKSAPKKTKPGPREMPGFESIKRH